MIAGPYFQSHSLLHTPCVFALRLSPELGLTKVVGVPEAGENGPAEENAGRVSDAACSRRAGGDPANGTGQADGWQALGAHFPHPRLGGHDPSPRRIEVRPGGDRVPDQLLHRGGDLAGRNFDRQASDVEPGGRGQAHHRGHLAFGNAEIAFNRLARKGGLGECRARLENVGDGGNAGAMASIRCIEKRLAFLDRCILSGEERAAIEHPVVRRLRSEDDVLNALVVQKIRRNQRRACLVDLSASTSEVEQELIQRKRRAEGRLREAQATGLRSRSRAHQRSIEVDLGQPRSATASHFRFR